jgi:hypothetical protein
MHLEFYFVFGGAQGLHAPGDADADAPLRNFRLGQALESAYKQKSPLDCSLSSSFDTSKLHPSMCGPGQRQDADYHLENHLGSKLTSCDASKGLPSIVDMEHVVANVSTHQGPVNTDDTFLVPVA